MSGGGNPFSGSSKGGMQTYDPVGSLGTNLINGVFGTNLLGQGGMSNNWATQVGNNITGGNLFNAGNNQLNAQNAANTAANPTSIPQLPINIPQGANPNSWAMPTPQGGYWNQIAQQMAGPVYTGGLQVPGVSPAMINMPIGAQPQSPGQIPPTPGSGKGGQTPPNLIGKIAAANASPIQQWFQGLSGGTNPNFQSGLSPRGSIRPF